MKEEQLSRTRLLLGDDKLERLRHCHVLVVGLGGVGGMAVEMLARAGIEHFTLVDGDKVALSNTNRQVIAFADNVGVSKTEAIASLLRRINPGVVLDLLPQYLAEEDIAPLLDRKEYAFVLDCIDTVGPKCMLLAECRQRKLPIISAMGAGAKTDPSRIKIGDISKTQYCSLARVVRRRLATMGIKKGIPVVFSTEEPHAKAVLKGSPERGKGSTVGSISYLPNMFGCFMAAYVLERL